MRKFLQYAITAIFGIVIAVLVLVSKETFSQTATDVIYKDLCDAFFVPGIMIAGFGLLTFASNGGSFDIIRYGLIKLFDLFKRDLTKVKYRSFYEYRKAQQENKRSFAFLLIVGCVFIVAAVVFLILYNNVV